MLKSRRTRTLIDFEVQYSLLRKIAAHWILFLSANAIALVFWIRLFNNPTGSWNEIWLQFGQQFLPFAIVSLALLPVFLLDAAKLSNRFVGPILRVRSTLAQLAKGDRVQPLKFRRGDFWQSLAGDFNKVFKLGSVESDAVVGQTQTGSSSIASPEA